MPVQRATYTMGTDEAVAKIQFDYDEDKLSPTSQVYDRYQGHVDVYFSDKEMLAKASSQIGVPKNAFLYEKIFSGLKALASSTSTKPMELGDYEYCYNEDTGQHFLRFNVIQQKESEYCIDHTNPNRMARATYTLSPGVLAKKLEVLGIIDEKSDTFKRLWNGNTDALKERWGDYTFAPENIIKEITMHFDRESEGWALYNRYAGHYRIYVGNEKEVADSLFSNIRLSRPHPRFDEQKKSWYLEVSVNQWKPDGNINSFYTLSPDMLAKKLLDAGFAQKESEVYQRLTEGKVNHLARSQEHGQVKADWQQYLQNRSGANVTTSIYTH